MHLRLMRWTLFFAVFMLAMQPSHSYTIAQKGRVSGQSIHTTYFLTPNNQGFDVRATLFVGQYLNGTCVYAGQYEVGKSFLKTGDFVDFDGRQIKSIAGGGYSCMSVYYYYTQPVIDTVQLVWDGFTYSNTIPASSEVTVL